MSNTPLKIGDYVTSAYPNLEYTLVRRVTNLLKGASSGWLVSADDGGKCQCCGRPFGTPIHFAPAQQFLSTKADPDNTARVKAAADDATDFVFIPK